MTSAIVDGVSVESFPMSLNTLNSRTGQPPSSMGSFQSTLMAVVVEVTHVGLDGWAGGTHAYVVNVGE